jgi:hypothetical protein
MRLRRVFSICAAAFAAIAATGAMAAGANAESVAPSATGAGGLLAASELKGATETFTAPDGSTFTSTTPVKSNAMLAGQFDWEAQIVCCLDSREWYSGATGYTNVKVSSARYINNNSCATVHVTLLRFQGVYWEELGSKSANCGPNDLIWHTTAGYDYKFHIYTGTSGYPYIKATGTVYYP